MDDGEEREISIEHVLKLHFETTKILFFDFMINCEKPSPNEFKKLHTKYCNKIISVLDEIYADHLEGIRNEDVKE